MQLRSLTRRHIGKLSGRAFNIGGGPGNTVSLLELIKRLEELLERRIELTFDAWRVGDQRYYVSGRSTGGSPRRRRGLECESGGRGCALVLADIPTLRELWDGAAEFLNPCDSAQLHSALNLLIADSEKRSSRGARAVA